jgi:hypothetical protein
MITVTLRMKLDRAPLKRVPVEVCLDSDGRLAGLLRTKGEH